MIWVEKSATDTGAAGKPAGRDERFRDVLSSTSGSPDADAAADP